MNNNMTFIPYAVDTGSDRPGDIDACADGAEAVWFSFELKARNR